MFFGKLTLAKKITIVTVGLVLSTSVIVIATFALGNNKNLIQSYSAELDQRKQYLLPELTKSIQNATTEVKQLGQVVLEDSVFENSKDKIAVALQNFAKTGHNLLEVRFDDRQTMNYIRILKDNDGKWKHMLESTVQKKNSTIPAMPQLEDFKGESHLHYSRIFPYNLIGFENNSSPQSKNGKLNTSFGDGISPEQSAIQISRRIQLPNGDVVGILSIIISLTSNIQFVKELSTPKYRIYLINQDGEYFFNMSQEKVFSSIRGTKYNAVTDYDDLKNVLTKNLGSVNFPQLMNKTGMAMSYQRIYLSRDTEEYWMGLIQIADYWEAIVEAEAVQRKTYMSAMLLVLMASFVAYWFSKVIAKNLHTITDVAVRYSRGETTVQLNVKGDDEIGVLANAFQGMIYQVNERTRRIKRSEEKAQKSKELMEEALLANQELLEDLKKQKQAVDRINKEKDDLLAVVSHDLKNPLSVIESSLDLLVSSPSNLPPDHLDLLKRSKKGARFAINLITDLLEMARLEGGIGLTPEVFDFQKLVNECIQYFTTQSNDKKVVLKCNVNEPIKVFGDYRRLSQVINNFISNAIKFTPEHGSITIDAKEINQALKTSYGSTKVLKVSITDTGIGIPADKLDKIFNKYEQARTKDRETGTGLGLTICKNICELHNGSIQVESKEGSGTTFNIILPILAENTYSLDLKRGKELLIYSDNPNVRESLTAALSNYFDFIQSRPVLELSSLSRSTYTNPIILVDAANEIIPALTNKMHQSNEWADVPIIAFTQKFSRDVLDLLQQSVDKIFEYPGDTNKLYFIFKDFIHMQGWNISDSARPMNNSSPNDHGESTSNAQVLSLKVEDSLKNTSDNKSEKHKSTEKLPVKVLVIDDSDDSHQLLKIMLKGQNVTLFHATDGKKGVEIYASSLPDLVLMDLNMPVLDGVKSTKVIRQWEQKKQLKPAKILGITASDDAQTIQRCIDAGMDGNFGKPFSKKELIELLEQMQQPKISLAA